MYRVRQNDLAHLYVKQKANKVKKPNNVIILEKYVKCHFFHIMPFFSCNAILIVAL